MTDATAEDAEAPSKASKLPLILGVVLALLGAVGGFVAVSSGMLPLGGGTEAQGDDGHAAEGVRADEEAHGDGPGAPALGDIAFLELPALVVSLGQGASNSHLRFQATLEVPSGYAEEVRALQPRVLDAMNGYLRALEPSDIEAQDALVVIRAQLTRRVQLVLGKERLRDLLVLEFVLN
ncbi:flagellar basal body-associated FliL family protein [Roseivivax sediminis]|uniref:Flagellar protein FliL n=1 Tax=Roseivivax sediminis TaxID=936889 RepID=A0A1I1UEC3_9RHOB|nr:flagellar basal body-associated FliL family protein [Roseivivax sediminis]SFD69181.1 flagellar FliL protein [Roseivivax sediminis]